MSVRFLVEFSETQLELDFKNIEYRLVHVTKAEEKHMKEASGITETIDLSIINSHSFWT